MGSNMTVGELGRVLLTLRGYQWVLGTTGDPYALLLRAEGGDPHALGRQVRERGDLYQSITTAWVTADHAFATAALADPRLAPRPVRSPGEPDDLPGDGDPMPWEIPPLYRAFPMDAAYLDGERADHARLLDAAAPLLGTEAVERHRPEAAGICERALKTSPPEFDLMTGYARPVAAAVTAAVLGLPPDQHDRFAALCAGTAGALDATFVPPHLSVARELTASVSALRELLAEFVDAERRVADRADALAAGCFTAVVGAEALANLICNALGLLFERAELRERLHDDPGAATQVIEETLRFDPPVRMQRLYAPEDIQVAGRDLTTGSELVVLVHAANRDPAAFTEPDVFDVRRHGPEAESPPLHLGPHGCPDGRLIAPLLRAGATVAVQSLSALLPAVHPAGPRLHRLRAPATRGTLRFPVAA
ncbi:P450-derived glycosyltransferase activator [Actinomadura viridis]|uniref:P450-derived glycosyltransferase activator n=1 Tax=Actinomadura viridis TaxID=58110 RepID=A0A931DG76_9ACTN|nr:P450-derived glycosyltransferase activator [Actinomadura viridis]MBG6090554.1 P450-derived glycosyltransferase activator [Actinomadura viridis]